MTSKRWGLVLMCLGGCGFGSPTTDQVAFSAMDVSYSIAERRSSDELLQWELGAKFAFRTSEESSVELKLGPGDSLLFGNLSFNSNPYSIDALSYDTRSFVFFRAGEAPIEVTAPAPPTFSRSSVTLVQGTVDVPVSIEWDDSIGGAQVRVHVVGDQTPDCKVQNKEPVPWMSDTGKVSFSGRSLYRSVQSDTGTVTEKPLQPALCRVELELERKTEHTFENTGFKSARVTLTASTKLTLEYVTR